MRGRAQRRLRRRRAGLRAADRRGAVHGRHRRLGRVPARARRRAGAVDPRRRDPARAGRPRRPRHPARPGHPPGRRRGVPGRAVPGGRAGRRAAGARARAARPRRQRDRPGRDPVRRPAARDRGGAATGHRRARAPGDARAVARGRGTDLGRAPTTSAPAGAAAGGSGSGWPSSRRSGCSSARRAGGWATRGGRRSPGWSGWSAAPPSGCVTAADLVAAVTVVHDDTVAAGRVAAVDPAADGRLRRGSTVRLTVSSGRPVVPAVAAGTTVATAEQAVRDAGLGPVTSSDRQEYSATVPAGEVIRTDPPAGTALPSGGAVTLVVSRGAEPRRQVRVPFLIGRTRADAVAALTALGLEVDVERAVPVRARSVRPTTAAAWSPRTTARAASSTRARPSPCAPCSSRLRPQPQVLSPAASPPRGTPAPGTAGCSAAGRRPSRSGPPRSASEISWAPPRHSVTSSPVTSTWIPPGCVPSPACTSKKPCTSSTIRSKWRVL